MISRPASLARLLFPDLAGRRLGSFVLPIFVLLPLLLAGMWWVLRPSETEMLGIAVRSGEYAGAPELDAQLARQGPGYVALQAEALIGEGEFARAGTLLRSALRQWPGDEGLKRLEIEALGQGGETAAALARAQALAAQSGEDADLRTVVSLAGALRQPAVQLPALQLLVQRGTAVEWERAAATQLQSAASVRPPAQSVLPNGVIPPPVAPAPLVAVTPPVTIAALRAGSVRQLPPDVARELVRTAFNTGQFADIALVDRVAGQQWRNDEPWIAMQLARLARDWPGALRHAARLPAGDVASARLAIFRDSNNTAGIRSMLIAEARRPGADRASIGRQLIELGDKDAGLAQLQRAAASSAPSSERVRELLYFAGPRPSAAMLDWLLARAEAARGADRLQWLALYAARTTPAAARATLAGQRDANTTPILLLQLETARGEAGTAAAQVLERLLDGRALARADLERMRDNLPATASTAQRLAIARLMEADGISTPRQRLDLAFADYNARRFAAARAHVQAYLAEQPSDAAGLTLAGDIARQQGRASEARQAWTSAIGATPRGRAGLRQRAELLERLGDERAALELVQGRARTGSDEAGLRALEARLLITTGRPAEAARLLEQAP